MSESIRVREAIHMFVLRYPGAHTREIERQLGLSNKLADYHLQALEEEGRVGKLPDHGYVRYFDRELVKALRAPEKRLVCLARRPVALRILVTLAAKGELRAGEITTVLRIAKPSTTYYLNLMREAGILSMRAEGRSTYYRLREPEVVRSFLATFQPLPGDLDAFEGMWRDLFGQR